jgi:hypothetical protein
MNQVSVKACSQKQGKNKQQTKTSVDAVTIPSYSSMFTDHSEQESFTDEHRLPHLFQALKTNSTWFLVKSQDLVL